MKLDCLVLQRRGIHGVPRADRRQRHGHLGFFARTQGHARQSLKLPKCPGFPTGKTLGSWLPCVYWEDPVQWPLVSTEQDQAGASSGLLHPLSLPSPAPGRSVAQQEQWVNFTYENLSHQGRVLSAAVRLVGQAAPCAGRRAQPSHMDASQHKSPALVTSGAVSA